MNIHGVKDARGFKEAEGQIMARMHQSLKHANRRNN
jgi:hypothetical protein